MHYGHWAETPRTLQPESGGEKAWSRLYTPNRPELWPRGARPRQGAAHIPGANERAAYQNPRSGFDNVTIGQGSHVGDRLLTDDPDRKGC